MALINDWSQWWRDFLGNSPDQDLLVIEILRQRYVEEMQRIERYQQHAARMRYPQYREKFLEMAQETSRHATRIGEKIVALGARLPDVEQFRSTDENSWRSLSMALDEENRSADRLPEQLRRIESDHPDIADLLQQISHQQENHRRGIQGMLMRSDPFAQSLA